MGATWYTTDDLKDTFEVLNEVFEKNFWDLTLHYFGIAVYMDRHLIPEIITKDQITDLVKETMDISIDTPECKILLDGLYFNANLNNPDVTLHRERASRVAMGFEHPLTDIEADLMSLYQLLTKNPFSKLRLTVLKDAEDEPEKERKRKQKKSYNDEGIVLDNLCGWFSAYLLNGINQAMPKVDSIEKAQQAYKEAADKLDGRKTDGDLTVMAVGIARLFKRCGLIEGNTTNALCKFIRSYFLLMGTINEHMPQKDYKNIQTSISGYLRKGEFKKPKDKRDATETRYKRIFIKGRWD